jgi:D-arabinose 1-dehydrogenase-like Zn-dependent alcohol dehydrogenase
MQVVHSVLLFLGYLVDEEDVMETGRVAVFVGPRHFVIKVPDELSNEAAAAVNCAAAQVLCGLRQADMRMGDHVVIQGAGGLGINAAAAAKEMGAASVISIDGVPSRLELARQCGADVVMEVAGYPQVVPEGIVMTRKGGAFVEIGNTSGQAAT